MDDESVLFVREGVESDNLPPAVASFLRTPACESADEPIEINGPWRGIVGADDQTALDLEPPYDVLLYVAQSSAPRYERAYLTVRVPASLGRPLDGDDIESSLWESGTIALSAHCQDGAYIAERVEARPPG